MFERILPLTATLLKILAAAPNEKAAMLVFDEQGKASITEVHTALAKMKQEAQRQHVPDLVEAAFTRLITHWEALDMAWEISKMGNVGQKKVFTAYCGMIQPMMETFTEVFNMADLVRRGND